MNSMSSVTKSKPRINNKRPGPFIVSLPAVWEDNADNFVRAWLEDYGKTNDETESVFDTLVVPVQTFKENIFNNENGTKPKGTFTIGKILSYNEEKDAFTVLIYAKFAKQARDFIENVDTDVSIDVGV